MNNNIDHSLTKIDDSKDKILGSYNKLMANYDDSRQLYEDLTSVYLEYTIPCSQIVAYNDETFMVSWQLQLLDGTVLYESKKYGEWKTMILNLDDLNMYPGTVFKLVSDNGSYTAPFLEYYPNCGTVYYEIKLRNFYSHVTFFGSYLFFFYSTTSRMFISLYL